MKRMITTCHRGYILLPVLASLALIALCAYMLNRTGAMEARVANSQSQEIQSRYIAEAGMNHAKWFLSFDCGYRAALVDIPFGTDHSYSTTLKDNTDDTIRMVATAVLHGQSPDTSKHYTEIITDDYTCVEHDPIVIYWTDPTAKLIRRVELDGSGLTDLLSAANGLVAPGPFAIDSGNRKMYWGDNNLIYRADLDGSLMEQIIDCVDCVVSGIDIDQVNNMLYYTDTFNDYVWWAELDGANNNSLVTSFLSQPGAIGVDPADGRFYFADQGNSEIKKDALNGTDLKTVKDGIVATALALNPVAHDIYYFDQNTWSIDERDYGGAGYHSRIFIGAGNQVNGIDFDTTNSKIYWAHTTDKKIQRSNIDGTGIEDVIATLGAYAPWDIALGPARPIYIPRTKGPYWTEDQGANQKLVRRSELDGTNIQTHVSAQAEATRIKYDPLTDRLYWAGDKMIMSSEVRGADLTIVHDCAVGACTDMKGGIALDPDNQLIYWADQGNKSISRVDYDGSNETVLIGVGINNPTDIDLSGNKIYWVDDGDDTLSRANINGTGAAILLSKAGGDPVDNPYSIIVDDDNSFIYWFSNATRTIYRSNLGGGGVTALIVDPDVDEAHALALDLDEGKLYWTEKSLKQIKRANLDGSNPEVVVDLTAESNKPPVGITIVPAKP